MKRLSHMILPIAALILEILPYGAVCNFASAPNEIHRETFSYFDLVPFGYANFAPFITAVLTCAILVILTIYCITGRHGIAAAARNLLIVCTAISLCPLLFGIDYFSVIGGFITAALAAETFWLCWELRKKAEQK